MREREANAQLRGEHRRIVALGGSAAPLRPRGAKGRNDDVTTRAYALAQGIEVGLPVLVPNEKMKHGPVVPQGVLSVRPEGGHVLVQQSN